MRNRARVILILLLYFLCCLIFVFSKDFNGLYGQDSHEYYRYSKSLFTWFQNGSNPGDYFWPVWYPLSAAMVSFVIKIPVLFSLQLISIISITVAIAVIIFWEGTEKITRERIWYSLIVVGISPYFLRLGLVNMADAMSVALVMLSYYSVKQLHGGRSDRWLIGFALFGTMAVMTRYASAIVLFPAFILVLRSLAMYKHWFIVLLSLAVALIVCLPHLIIRSSTPLAFVSHEWLTTWSLLNFFKTDFVTKDGASFYMMPNIIYALGGLFLPAFGVAYVLLLPFFRKQDLNSVLSKTLFVSVLIYGLFLAGIPFQNKRFLLAILPLAAILLFPAFDRYIRIAKFAWAPVVAIAVAHLFLFYHYFGEIESRNKMERNLAEWVNLRPEKVLYSFDVDVAIKSYVDTKDFRNMWVCRYDSFTIGSLVLFNEVKLRKQWKGKNPMLNWANLTANYSLISLKEEKSGWELFRIESRNK